MAHPTTDTLNSLVSVLRKAKPLFEECSSILKQLRREDDSELPVRSQAAGGVSATANRQRRRVLYTPYIV